MRRAILKPACSTAVPTVGCTAPLFTISTAANCVARIVGVARHPDALRCERRDSNPDTFPYQLLRLTADGQPPNVSSDEEQGSPTKPPEAQRKYDEKCDDPHVRSRRPSRLTRYLRWREGVNGTGR